jgi:hypothetical protein
LLDAAAEIMRVVQPDAAFSGGLHGAHGRAHGRKIRFDVGLGSRHLWRYLDKSTTHVK